MVKTRRPGQASTSLVRRAIVPNIPDIRTVVTRNRTMRPTSEEYAQYYGKYVSLVPDDDMDVVHHLADQHHETVDALRKAKSKGDFAYAPGKWTIKQVVGHVCDAERIFAYRALRFGRGDSTDLAGFE